MAVIQQLTSLNDYDQRYTVYLVQTAGPRSPSVLSIFSSKGYTPLNLGDVKLEGESKLIPSIQLARLLFANKSQSHFIKKLVIFSGSPTNATYGSSEQPPVSGSLPPVTGAPPLRLKQPMVSTSPCRKVVVDMSRSSMAKSKYHLIVNFTVPPKENEEDVATTTTTTNVD
eukprot:gene12190-14267_t